MSVPETRQSRKDSPSERIGIGFDDAYDRGVKDTARQPLTGPGPEDGVARYAKGERSREAILSAAKKLFAERGYLGISLDEISKRSGAKRSLILYHFKSKIGLWRAASAHAAAEFNQAVREKVEQLDQTDSENARYGTLAAWFDAFLENPLYPKMLVLEGNAPSPRLEWLVEHFGYATNIPGTPLLQERMSQTVLRDVLMAIFLAMSALGPLMEASMAQVTGSSKTGIYPMSKTRRAELIEVLIRILEAFETGES